MKLLHAQLAVQDCCAHAMLGMLAVFLGIAFLALMSEAVLSLHALPMLVVNHLVHATVAITEL